MAFDLDAALGLPFTFTFGGNEYTLPPDVDFATLEALEGERLTDAFRGLLGADQWAQLEAAPEVFGARAFTSLMNAYMEHLGLRPGESPALSPSSESTAGPSKRTSNGSTGSTSDISASPRMTATA